MLLRVFEVVIVNRSVGGDLGLDVSDVLIEPVAFSLELLEFELYGMFFFVFASCLEVCLDDGGLRDLVALLQVDDVLVLFANDTFVFLKH